MRPPWKAHPTTSNLSVSNCQGRFLLPISACVWQKSTALLLHLLIASFRYSKHPQPRLHFNPYFTFTVGGLSTWGKRIQLPACLGDRVQRHLAGGHHPAADSGGGGGRSRPTGGLGAAVCAGKPQKGGIAGVLGGAAGGGSAVHGLDITAIWDADDTG